MLRNLNSSPSLCSSIYFIYLNDTVWLTTPSWASSEFNKNLKLNIGIDLVSPQSWIVLWVSRRRLWLWGSLSWIWGHPSCLIFRVILLWVIQISSLHVFSRIFVANENMSLQLFCIDKGKDSTSDLDQEIDFQKKMMDVSSGSRGMQRCSVSDWWSLQHLRKLPRPHPRKYTNSGHNCSSRRCLPPQSHF